MFNGKTSRKTSCFLVTHSTISFSLSLSLSLCIYIYTNLSLYIYVYICIHMYLCICLSIYMYLKWNEISFIYIYIYIWGRNISSLKHICKNFWSTYFCIDPFKLPYRLYDIRLELVNKSSIINWLTSTFCLILSHHQGCVYCKSDVTSECILLFCNSLYSLYLGIVGAFIFKIWFYKLQR